MEYIDWFELEISRQGVLWRINHNISLPHVSKIERIGRSYVLTVII